MTEKTVTEREATLRERKAWLDGVRESHEDRHRAAMQGKNVGMYSYDTESGLPLLRDGQIRRTAEERYPLPKVTRPRVVHTETKRNGFAWMMSDEGCLKYAYGSVKPSIWNDLEYAVTHGNESVAEDFRSFARLAADLDMRSTEEVDQ